MVARLAPSEGSAEFVMQELTSERTSAANISSQRPLQNNRSPMYSSYLTTRNAPTLSYAQFCAGKLGVSSVTVPQRVEIELFEREHSSGRLGSCWLGRPAFESWQRFSLLENNRDRLWSLPGLTSSAYMCSFPWAKRPGREIDHSHPSSAEVKNEWSCTSSPPVCLRGMDRDNFTLRQCHVLAYFGSASLVDTLVWFT